MWHGDQYGPDQDLVNSLSAENADLHNESVGLRALVAELVEALEYTFGKLSACYAEENNDDLIARARAALSTEGTKKP